MPAAAFPQPGTDHQRGVGSGFGWAGSERVGQPSGGLQVLPEGQAALLSQLRRATGGGGKHQLAPVAAAPPPAPRKAEGIEGKPALGAAAAADHGLPPEQGGDLPAELVGPGQVPPQQGHGELSLRIHHHHGWILLFAAQQRRDQPGDQAAGSHRHHS